MWVLVSDFTHTQIKPLFERINQFSSFSEVTHFYDFSSVWKTIYHLTWTHIFVTASSKEIISYNPFPPDLHFAIKIVIFFQDKEYFGLLLRTFSGLRMPFKRLRNVFLLAENALSKKMDTILRACMMMEYPYFL